MIANADFQRRDAHRRPSGTSWLGIALIAPWLLIALTQVAWAQPGSLHNKLIAAGAILAISVVVFGVVALYFQITGRRHGALAAASATWPTTPGKVLRSGVLQQRRPKGGSTYRSDICYEYTVAGRRHEGDVVQFGSLDMATAAAAQKILDPYPVGTNVVVHYKPDDPAVATLETTAAAAHWRLRAVSWTLLIGVAIYVVLTAFVLFAA
jgi:hypothetical protein